MAVEILHTYTLIHDDLPCMDDDALRRGQPTAHVKFGEANAVLAGDALLTLAFEWMADHTAPAPYAPGTLSRELATASGCGGVIAGQVEDLAAEHEEVDEARLRFIHLHKTASLIRASVRLGAIAGGAGPEILAALSRYGEDIGLAFQVVDDILNVVGTQELGKPTGSDAARGKATYVALYGIDAARLEAKKLVQRAEQALDAVPGDTRALRALARHVLERST
jgi:farnesyl diphosphate synthase